MEISFLRLGPNDVPFFLGALGLAMAIVFFFSRRRFGESTMEKKPEDFIAQILPEHLATREEYSNGLLTYIAIMISLLLALSFLGNPILDFLQIKIGDGTGSAVVAPILIALALVGLLTKADVPYLKEIEWHIRYFAHQRAFIPASALATAEKLTAAGFDFSQYRDPDTLTDMQGVEATDFDRPRGSILYSWARLNCLLHALGRYDTYLDGELLQHYERDLNSIYMRQQELVSELAKFRSERTANPGHTDEPLRRKLKTSLWQLYVLVGCAVRLKAKSERYETWSRFGFQLGPVAAPPENQNAMVVGLAVMTGSVFAIVYAAFGLAQTELWQAKPPFPAKAYETLIWALSAGMVHGAAILASNHIRSYLNRKDRWFSTRGDARVAVPANYVRLAVGCGLVGYAVLFLWSLIFQAPTLGMALSIMPFALLPATTGAFYAYHLDNVELGQRPPRHREVIAQAFATGCVGFVTAGTWLSLGNLPWISSIDYVLLVTAIGAVIGASLGWYIPEAVSQSRYDPLADARKERISSLRTAATDRFGENKAREWLSTPSALLKNMTPTTAAATIEGYQDAVALLHRPPEQHTRPRVVHVT